MRLRSLFKTSVVFFGCCLFIYFLLYMQAGRKESTQTELLSQLKLVREKGMVGLKMEWLHQVNKVTRPSTSPHAPKHSPAKPNVKNTSSPAKQHILQMSQIYEELDFINAPGGVWKQGFPITYDLDQWAKRPLEVFVVPHSHQDPGWVMTFDEYFQKKTKPCLDSTLKVLERRPEARFSYAEISFFSLWVETLTDDEKKRVKDLLHSGQLEVVSGGWVMTDEAAAHHYAMLDQLIEGHHWLLENFNYRPNVSWSIDPFGHSPTMAYLARKMRFSGMVLQRVHYEVKKYLAQRKLLEFGWHQHWDNDGHTEILTHMMPFYSYDIPHTCGPDPAICCQFDFVRLQRIFCPWKIPPKLITPNNVAERAGLLADQYRKKAMLFNNTDVLLVPLGDDFRYLSEREWVQQLDNYNQLMEHLNSNPDYRIKVRFATVSDYINALHERLQTRPNEPHLAAELNQFVGDMFTYADRDQDYWSGYFTSRPTEKSLVRHLESELRSAELLYSYTHRFLTLDQTRLPLLSEFQLVLFQQLTEARRALGLFQHHDGVTGTSIPEVVLDYATRLLKAIEAARFVSSVSAAHLLLLSTGEPTRESNPRLSIPSALKLHLKTLLNNVSDLPTVFSFEDTFITQQLPLPKVLKLDPQGAASFIYLFNPVLHSRTFSTTLMLQGPAPETLLVSQSISDGRKTSEHQLSVQLEPSNQVNHFLARIGPVKMDPMSLIRLSIRVDGKTRVTVTQPLAMDSRETYFSLNSDAIELRFDVRTGLLKQFIDRRSGLYLDLLVDFVEYHTTSEKSHSGAYLFIPEGNGQVMELPKTPQLRIIRGPLSEEVTVYTPYVNHTVRLYKDARYPSQAIEIENSVDLSLLDDLELVMRVRTNLTADHRTFFTDSNCFQFIQRTYYDKLPLQGNLYPMTCAAFVEGFPEDRANRQARKDLSDPRIRINLLTDHSRGVTSTNSGELMVWLDRRAPVDDERGVYTPLLGVWVTQSRFNLYVETIQPETTGQFGGVPRLSFPAHRALTDLIRPVQRIFVSANLSSLMVPHFRLFGDAQIPCDYELVNFKTYHSQSEAFQTVLFTKGVQLGLVLHRLGPFVKSSQPLIEAEVSQYCKNKNPKFDIKALFAPLMLSHAAKMRRITMIPEPGEQLHWMNSVLVEPMELEAFVLN